MSSVVKLSVLQVDLYQKFQNWSRCGVLLPGPHLFPRKDGPTQYLVAFPFPDHIVWHSPGFFSLTVPYDPTRDFFYSGHTGGLTVIML